MIFIFIIKDFGIHVDDIDQAKLGNLVLQQILDNNNQDYLKLGLSVYSPDYEVFLSIISGFFHTAQLDVFLIRHIVIFNTYYLGVNTFAKMIL